MVTPDSYIHRHAGTALYDILMAARTLCEAEAFCEWLRRGASPELLRKARREQAALCKAGRADSCIISKEALEAAAARLEKRQQQKAARQMQMDFAFA